MKKVLEIHKSSSPHWVGDGFPVRGMFASRRFSEAVSPFLLLDYGGPMEFPPAENPRGVEAHPHRGFETVTIVYQGELEHRDSAGNHGSLGPGDVQWMTAASGIVHEEKHSRAFTERGGVLEMVQLWVNLPAKFKTALPAYQTLLHRDIPVIKPVNGGTVRVIAGNFLNTRGPARTFTPINLWDMRLQADHTAELQVPDGHTTILVNLRGKILLNETASVEAAEMALFDRRGEKIILTAREDATLLVLSGEPIPEPVVSHGPFVMNTDDEIRQAIMDYHSGRMGRIE